MTLNIPITVETMRYFPHLSMTTPLLSMIAEQRLRPDIKIIYAYWSIMFIYELPPITGKSNGVKHVWGYFYDD